MASREDVRAARKRMSKATGPPRSSYLASLKAATILTVDSKASLPAEILVIILDYLPVPDLMRFARASKRMQEMVYDDTRWVQRLRIIGCWNELEARQRSEEALRRRTDLPQRPREGPENVRHKQNAQSVNGSSQKTSSALFDAGWEEQRHSTLPVQPKPAAATAPLHRFDSSTADGAALPSATAPGNGVSDTQYALHVLKNVRSIRGQARQEYGKVHGMLAPLYNDLVRSTDISQPIVFKKFKDPEHQAQMLAQLRTFSKGDLALGWAERENALGTMIAQFENAVLREFEASYKSRDIDGRMRRFAHVLVALNDGAAAIDLYIHNHRLMADKSRLGNPLDCLEHSFAGHVNLHPANSFFQRLCLELNEESVTIERVFPPSTNVMLPFLGRICDDIITPYITPLFDEAHNGNHETYLKIVSGIYEQCLSLVSSLNAPKGSEPNFRQKANDLVNKCFEPHVDLYLKEELDEFLRKVKAEVDNWERKLSEQEASTESYFMSNLNRSAEKRDFMSSFKKMFMAPVNALPTFSSSKQAPTTTVSNPSVATATGVSESGTSTPERSASPRPEAPTTELAAKAAIMNSQLESMGSLFSLEVALNMVHAARSSIERTAQFANMTGQLGEDAKLQCENVFVNLLQILASRHIQPGFDKAIDHLTSYSASKANDHSNVTVQPLVTFLELVNVGDLIQQMLDVFYSQELVGKKLTDRDDFTDPAVKEKKRFEQMLDERVATGLGKGIDVLMDEVDYICATTQLATDYNPNAGAARGSEADAVSSAIDIGPTKTALHVVELVASHTGMLTGAADRNMLDVFNQEVGLRLFSSLSKHLKRQRISTMGAIKLISDINHYYGFIQTLKNKELLAYFRALRELSQIFLVDPTHSKEIATIIADGDRYRGIFTVEEVLQYAERRADWYQIRGNVEKAMYGIGCALM